MTALDALKAASFALNMIPKYRFPHGEYRDSYEVAALIDRALKGEPEAATTSPAIAKKEADRFTLRAEAATCLWEALIDLRNGCGTTEATAAKVTQINLQWDKSGAVTMRHAAIALAEVCADAFDGLTEEEQESLTPYDWHFCPAFILALSWEDHGDQPVTIPSLAEAVAMMKEASKTAVAHTAIT